MKKLSIKNESIIYKDKIKNYSLDCVDFIKKYKYIFLVLVLIAIPSYLSFYKNTTTVDNDKAVSEVVKKVSKLISLPTNEVPTMFEISDPSLLIGKEPFFIGSEKGDILLIYQKYGKALIYSKNKNIIINYGPLVNNK